MLVLLLGTISAELLFEPVDQKSLMDSRTQTTRVGALIFVENRPLGRSEDIAFL